MCWWKNLQDSSKFTTEDSKSTLRCSTWNPIMIIFLSILWLLGFTQASIIRWKTTSWHFSKAPTFQLPHFEQRFDSLGKSLWMNFPQVFSFCFIIKLRQKKYSDVIGRKIWELQKTPDIVQKDWYLEGCQMQILIFILIVYYIPWNRAMEGPGCLGWNSYPVFVGRELCRGPWASFANGIHFQNVLQGWKKGEENRPQTAWWIFWFHLTKINQQLKIKVLAFTLSTALHHILDYCDYCKVR